MIQSRDGTLDIGASFDALNMTFNKLNKYTIKLNGIKFMNPKILIRFYEKLGRPKDQEKIKIIKDNLI